MSDIMLSVCWKTVAKQKMVVIKASKIKNQTLAGTKKHNAPCTVQRSTASKSESAGDDDAQIQPGASSKIYIYMMHGQIEMQQG